MKECEGHLGQVEFNQIIMEVYGDVLSPLSDTNFEFLSSGSMEALMEMSGSYIDYKVLSYNHNTMDTSDISKLYSNIILSSSGNGEDVILEPCIGGE